MLTSTLKTFFNNFFLEIFFNNFKLQVLKESDKFNTLKMELFDFFNKHFFNLESLIMSLEHLLAILFFTGKC